MKTEVLSFSEPRLEYNLDRLWQVKIGNDLLSQLESYSWILYSFRLVLEEKAGNEIPESSRLEFLEKFSANNFIFIRYKREHVGTINQRRYSRLTYVEINFSNSTKIARVKFMRSDRLFRFISTFGSFKNLLTTISIFSCDPS